MASPSQASLLLQKQLKDLCKNPVDGFSAGLVDESNLFEWSVTIIGPPDTLYDGGFFNAIMTFPQNYPNSPPTVRFTSEVWHPNVYPDGKVCISILHPPGDDPNGYELASERWTPVHTTRLEGISANRKGQFSVVLEIYEVAPSLFMVDVRKAAGDKLEYHKFYKSFCAKLDHIIWKPKEGTSDTALLRTMTC